MTGFTAIREALASLERREDSMPVLFVGHGSPMNALADNRYTQAWRAFGREAGMPVALKIVQGDVIKSITVREQT